MMALLAIPAPAFAGNDDEILIGTQGARLGGAVTATVTDSTALWYNPGAIGRTRWAQFGVSGSLVQLRAHHSSGNSNDLELEVVPSTLGHEIPLPNDWAFSYGIFTSLSRPASKVQSARHLYNFGAGLGAPLGSTLRVGVGLFASYEHEQGSPTSYREALSSFASLGLHWAPTPNWNLGVAINSPRMLLISEMRLSDSHSRPGFSASTPMRVRAGIAHDFGRLVVSLDGDIQPALRNPDAEVFRVLVPNGRLGLDYELDEQTRLGMGFFTDLGSESNAYFRQHFYGVSGGIETATRYQLDPNEPAESIELTAFVGFRYAYGTSNDLTTHEFGINLGSGLRF